MDLCSIGKLGEARCHLETYTLVKTLQSFSAMSEEQQELILLRSGANCSESKNISTICEHHKYYYLNAYETHQKMCCDPTNIHKQPVKKSLRSINLASSKLLRNKKIFVNPGQKLCITCRKIVKIGTEAYNEEESDLDDPDVIFHHPEIRRTSIEDVNKSLDSLGCSPIKQHAIPSSRKASYGKRKLEKVSNVLEKKVYQALDIGEDSSCSGENSDEIVKKARDFDDIMLLLKEKVAKVGTSEKIKILTLAPPSWTKERIMSEFKVSDYVVRQAKKLKTKFGILSNPEPKKGKIIPDYIVKLVTDFYQNDEYSRMLPGAKDKVSVKINMYMQKRLILCNLKELYSCFKLEYSNVKIGFSKFCELRPKWCVLAGAAGTHSVCVCCLHQNVKLLLDAFKIQETYKELMSFFLVCDLESSNCMLQHCDNCPSSERLAGFLTEKLQYINDQEIEYKQWVNTDRTELIKQSSTVDDFLEILIQKLQALIPHSYISKCQSKSFQNLKNNLPPNKAILLLDFAENYTFIIQNEIQSYHWTRNSCTIHPVCIYLINNENELEVINHCFISEDMDHDVGFVNLVQKKTAKWLAEECPQIKSIHYFTDGCAAQYKNRKSFTNLCYHKSDFGIEAEHSFFATSHGKSVCDGLGGTVKRVLRKASLQLADDKQITTAEGVYNFCKINIEKCHFHYLAKNEINLQRKKLEERFLAARTIPGTRSFHNYKPLSSDSLELRRVTCSNLPSLVFSFDKNVSQWSCIRPQPNAYVAAVYDEKWYFALVKNVCDDKEDAELLFLHPPGPAVSFFWPYREEFIQKN